MRPRSILLHAILALPILLFVPATPTADREKALPDRPPPHPQEVQLLDELSTWIWRDSEPANLAVAVSSRSAGFDAYRRYLGEKGDQRRHLESLPYGEAIFEAARRNGLDSFLVAAVVEAESSFRADVVSPRGAIGLMQVMPGTARLYGVDPHDPHLNLDAGTRYLRSLLHRFDGDVGLALAAYNAGPTRVARYGRVPPFPETTRFLERVLRRYLQHHQRVWPRPLDPPLSAR